MHRFIIAEVFAAETQHRFSAIRGPVLFTSFNTTTDLFDRGLYQAARQWKALPTITWVVHPLGVVFVVHARRTDD